MIKHLIFDFDGVIADTHDINWAISSECDPAATYEDFLAHHDGNVFAEPRIKFSIPGFFSKEYKKHLNINHLSKAVGPLKRFKKDYSLYIISSTREEIIKEVLEKAGILDLFTRVMGPETHRSKIEKFKMLMAEHGIADDNTIFITDTLGDIKEAHKVGIKTIAETFGFHNRERLALGEPYKIVDSWEEVERSLEEISNN